MRFYKEGCLLYTSDRKSSSFGTESKYYSWRDDKGNKGHQFYQPFYYNIVAGPWEYGLATGFISSDNRSNDNGLSLIHI